MPDLPPSLTGPDLADVPVEKLRAAVEKMARELGIPGSVAAVYSLYDACLLEREKAIAQRQQWLDFDKNNQA